MIGTFMTSIIRSCCSVVILRQLKSGCVYVGEIVMYSILIDVTIIQSIFVRQSSVNSVTRACYKDRAKTIRIFYFKDD